MELSESDRVFLALAVVVAIIIIINGSCMALSAVGLIAMALLVMAKLNKQNEGDAQPRVGSGDDGDPLDSRDDGRDDEHDDGRERMPRGAALKGEEPMQMRRSRVCYDNEENSAGLDIDEKNTYQARGRNDHTRVVAGTMNRRRMVDPYMREELEEEEASLWWGQHEY